MSGQELYEIRHKGTVRGGIEALEIESLFRDGSIDRHTECRRAGEIQWASLNELFPLLKYRNRVLESAGPSGRARDADSFQDKTKIRCPLTSAVLAGCVCLGIGVLFIWLFPVASCFFGVAAICGTVAMCSFQVWRGIAILSASIAGTAVSWLITMAAIGAVLERELEEWRSSFPQLKPHARATLVQPTPAATPGFDLQPFPALTVATPTPSRSSPRLQPTPRPPVYPSPTPYDTSVAAQTRRAERDRANDAAEKAERERIGRQIKSSDELARYFRLNGNQVPLWLEENRNQLSKRLRELDEP